jgi:hypothetical protein
MMKSFQKLHVSEVNPLYKAIILGHSRQYKAKTLNLLLRSLERDRYRINPQELKRVRKHLEDKRPVVVSATRRLTQSELIREHIRKPYIWPPRLEQKEQVKVRLEYHEHL